MVLLGAGGAARGAILALADAGRAANIHLLNRDAASRQDAGARRWRRRSKRRSMPGALDDWTKAAGDAALLVNTTSAGMSGNPPLDIDLAALPKDAAVCDIVYNPLETDLLKDARGARPSRPSMGWAC